MSSVGLTEAEDWLDVGEVASLPFLSIDDVLNEVDHLDDSLSFLEDPEDNSVLGSSTSPSTFTSYHLDCAVRIKTLESITHQLLSLRGKGGTAHAVAESEGRIAIVTSRGMLLLFDRQGRLEHFVSGEEWAGSASCVSFSTNGKSIAIGYSKGSIKVLSAHNGSVVSVLRECVQVGHGILQVLFLDNTRSLLALDSGGSVFEIRIQRSIAGKSNQHVRCVFSGCNGEVVHMRLLSHSLLAFLTVSKVLIVSVKFGGSVLYAFPLRNSAHWPPLIDVCEQNSSNDISICIGRGDRLSIFRLHTSCLSQKNRAASLLRIIILSTPIVNLHWITDNIIISLDRKGSCLIIDCNKGLVTRSTTPEVQLLFATSDYKGLATGGNVSAALRCLAECICYQSVCRQKRAVLVLAHDGLYEFGLLSGDEQFELFQSRGDEISSCLFLLDVVRGRVQCELSFSQRAPELLHSTIKKLTDITVDGCKAGKVADLITHYKKYIAVLLRVCIGARVFSTLYGDIWPKLERDFLSRSVFLESLDEWIMDGVLEEPPPSLVSAYLSHLTTEGHFSQLQSSIVRFPIHSIDLHYVMSTCRQNGLYDGIIYVMNKALIDYISPLEEMLDNLSVFASKEVLSDAEVEQGNRLLLYLHCCLAGRAYPFGSLPTEQVNKVPIEVYRCITSVKGKDGSASKENYPYLRLLLLFDAQQFVHVICTCVDSPLFQSEGRLQRLTEMIGLLATELRKETVLVHFLLMVSQLVDNNHILAPVEIVDASVACLLRLTWQDPSAERSVVDILRSVPQLDRSAVLRMAQSPFRPRVCTLIYFDERRFIDLINCYILDNSSHEVFSAIRSIQQADLSPREFEDVTVFIRSIIPRLSQIDPVECAQILIDYFSDQLSVLRVESSDERSAYFPLINAAFQLRRDRLESFLSNDEDLDEYLFGIVFEGIVRRGGDGLSTSLKSILTYWLPLGSRTDFCLNIAAEAGCVEATIMLMESRQLINQAFELLFDQLQSNIGNDGMMVQWLDNMLSFCARHSSLAHGQGWLMQIFRCITQATVDNGSHDVDSRLQSLTARILESGSEHALELLQCLMEYPAFRDGLYRDYAPLINAILSACSFETSVIRDLLFCMEWEGASGLSSMSRQLCRRLEHTVDGKCINCGKGLQKSAYLFSCGHIMHMQCDDGNRSCSCLKGKPQNVQSSRKSFATEEIKWRRKTQAEKHETRDVFATWNKPLRLAPGTLDDGNTF